MARLGADLKVIRNDELSIEEIEALHPEKIMFSLVLQPNEAGVSLDVIKHFGGKIPILGICLGHQAIGQAFGGRIVRAKRMMHGKTSTTKQLHNSCLFEGLPETFTTQHDITL